MFPGSWNHVSMTATPDDIALLVQTQYDALPPKRKPVVRDNGLHEWVPLSGIVAEVGKEGKLYCLALATGMKCLPASKLPQAHGTALHDSHAEVLAIRAFNRFVLDECRQLALRPDAESLFLRRAPGYEKPLPGIGGDGDGSGGGGCRHPFVWRHDVRLHMYCSEAPCGDASMELTMAAQADAAPWAVPPPPPPTSSPTNTTTTSTTPTTLSSSFPVATIDGGGTTPAATATPLPGRAYFSLLGVVRRKPARADAPATGSKSCSDKLALRQCVSLLSSLTSLLVAPGPVLCPGSSCSTGAETGRQVSVYIHTLVLPRAQYSARGCQRAFSAAATTDSNNATGKGGGRMVPLLSTHHSWTAGYAFRPFSIRTTDSEFRFSRRAVGAAEGITPCNLALAWTAPALISTTDTDTGTGTGTGIGTRGVEESTLGGLLRGYKTVDPRGRGASVLCRRRMWGLAVEVAGLLPASGSGSGSGSEYITEVRRALAGLGVVEEEELEKEIEEGTYAAVKASPLLAARRKVKRDVRATALRGWIRNLGDDGFLL